MRPGPSTETQRRRIFRRQRAKRSTGIRYACPTSSYTAVWGRNARDTRNCRIRATAGAGSTMGARTGSNQPDHRDAILMTMGGALRAPHPDRR